eukprot:COSAG01_NODE_6078_length_3864_cov_12.433510_4_plen_59_part_00
MRAAGHACETRACWNITLCLRVIALSAGVALDARVAHSVEHAVLLQEQTYHYCSLTAG